MGKLATDKTIEQIETLLVGYAHSPFYCRSHLVVPNVSWGFINHEADLLVMSKARLLTEIEIKRSWSDFIADFKKDHDHSHPLIARFYYAVPSSIGKRVFDYLYNGEYDAKYWYSKSRVNCFTQHNPHGCGLIIYDLDTCFTRVCINVTSQMINYTFATAKVIKIAISQDDFTKKNRLSKQSIFHMFMKTIPSFSP